MKSKIYFVAGMIGVVTIAAVSMHLAPVAAAQGSTSTPPVFISAQTAFGMVVVNQSSGAITFCANNSIVPSGGGQAPIGTCSGSSIGSVTPTVGSNNSLSIAGSGGVANGSGSGALVYNNQTGQAVLCAGSGVVSGGVANVVASCKSVSNLH